MKKCLQFPKKHNVRRVWLKRRERLGGVGGIVRIGAQYQSALEALAAEFAKQVGL